MATISEQLNILLVENSDSDILLIQKAFEHTQRHPNLHVVKNGESALDFLQRRPPYETAIRPDIIILDLNLPKISGVEVLHTLKTDAQLKVIPVIILSVSNSPYDILATYQQHANCYLVKPRDFTEFMELVQRIDDFWRGTVRLPTQL